MRNPDSGLAYDLLAAIHAEPTSTPALWAETVQTDNDVVTKAITYWKKTDVVYETSDGVYLTEKGRKELGLYVRPSQPVGV